jgi:hypothetical protein
MVVDAPSAPNGTSAAAPSGETDAASNSRLTRAERDAAERQAFLDDEEVDEAIAAKSTTAAKPAPKKPTAKPVVEDDDDETDDELAALADDVEDEDDDLEDDDDEVEAASDDVEDDDEEDEDGKETTADPELAKRLAKVRKREQRAREQDAARDRTFEQKVQAFNAELKPRLEALDEFEKLKSKKSDPVALMKALGYSEDEFLEVSQILYGLSKVGQADPKYREHAKRLLKDRDLAEKADAADRRSAELEKKLADRDTQAETDRKVDAYRARIVKTVSDETPLLKKRLQTAPKATQARIDKVWLELAKNAGKLEVDPKKVARLVEKKLRTTVERAKALAGDDTETTETKTTAKPKVAAKAAPVKKPAITVIDKTGEAAAKKSAVPSRADMIEDLRRIDRGELDPNAD